jgi:hypothetical protein
MLEIFCRFCIYTAESAENGGDIDSLETESYLGKHSSLRG